MIEINHIRPSKRIRLWDCIQAGTALITRCTGLHSSKWADNNHSIIPRKEASRYWTIESMKLCISVSGYLTTYSFVRYEDDDCMHISHEENICTSCIDKKQNEDDSTTIHSCDSSLHSTSKRQLNAAANWETSINQLFKQSAILCIDWITARNIRLSWRYSAKYVNHNNQIIQIIEWHNEQSTFLMNRSANGSDMVHDVLDRLNDRNTVLFSRNFPMNKRMNDECVIDSFIEWLNDSYWLLDLTNMNDFSTLHLDCSSLLYRIESWNLSYLILFDA